MASTSERLPEDAVIRSPLLTRHGFRHAFTTRLGGASAAPFGPANYGRRLGDDERAVEENHRRLYDTLGVSGIFEISQVHGRRVRKVGGADRIAAVRQEEGDGLWTKTPDRAVAVRTADCIPVLLAHPPTGAVAAVHAGWRGVEARIVGAAVEAMALPADELIAAIGPHIRADRFEVGDDVAARLAAASEATRVIHRRAQGAGPQGEVRAYVDLTAVLRAQLSSLGLGQVDDVGGCTHTDSGRFHSYRRDGKRSGRLLSVIVAPGG